MANGKVRVGIVGVGNCASSFVQGLSFYAEASANDTPPGLMHVVLGGYHVRDIVIASAFDIHAGKVGQDVARAIFVSPNNTYRFATPDPTGAIVQRGPALDGVGRYMHDHIPLSAAPEINVAGRITPFADPSARILPASRLPTRQ